MAFQTYQTFASNEDAQQLIGILIDNNIEFKLEKNEPDINPIFVGTLTGFDVLVKIDESDFEKVNELYRIQEKVELENIDQSHYLFSFSEEELMEIILKPDEWNNYDYQVAKLLLAKKGTAVTSTIETGIKKKRETELNETREIGIAVIIFGYIASFLGGIVGIAIGAYIWQTYKRLPNGSKHFIFSKNNRDHGRAITFIGIIFFITFFILRLFYQIQLLNE